MSAFLYLVMGGVAYITAFKIYLKIIHPNKNKQKFDIRHPFIIKCLLGCFLTMLPISFLIGKFILGHVGIDWMYIVINSLVATVVFYFGLTPDDTNIKLPD